MREAPFNTGAYIDPNDVTQCGLCGVRNGHLAACPALPENGGCALQREGDGQK